MTVLADRYELAEELGAGGMARVVAAHDRTLDRRVAIKLIREELLGDATVRDRLLREARAAGRLHHPNTVTVHDVGEDDGRGFVVMELVTGTTLARHLADGPLAADRAALILAAVLAGLQVAHDHGLVHRDVKPSNILLPAAGGVKLADFGIARGLAEASSKLTATGTVLGTPSYLAPEVLGGTAAVPASDLYAVGVVLYEALSGRVPFRAESPIAVALAHQHEPPPPLADHAPAVPAALVAVVERALAKDPVDRFPDAATMRSALLDAVGNPSPTVIAPVAPTPGTSPSATTSPVTTPPVTSPPAAIAPATVTPVTLPPATVGLDDPTAGEGDVAELGGPRWQRPAVVVAILAVAALVGLLIALGGPDTDDGTTTADTGTDAPVGEAPDGTDEPDALPPAGDPDAEPSPPEQPGPPGTDDGDPLVDDEVTLDELDTLIDGVIEDPDRYGDEADGLLDELQVIRTSADPAERARDARALMVDIAELRGDGALTPSAGRELIGVLDPVGRPAPAELHDVHEVFVAITRDPGRFGARADDVLDDLEELLDDTDPDDRRDDAAALLEDLGSWVDEREVRRSEARALRAALEALVG